MTVYDVAVIGAGPAGSVAAQRLAAAGSSVALIEQAAFPRDKTCGDLVTREGLEVLQNGGLGDWASQFHCVESVRFSSPDLQILEVPVSREGKVIARIIPRRLLDNQLASSAVKAGAELFENVRVQSIEESEKYLTIRAGGKSLDARLLILADGSHAPVTRKLGLTGTEIDLIAIQQYLAGDIDPKGPIEFHFQTNILPGYTWLFPMGDGHLNIGAGTYTHRVSSKSIDLKQTLELFKNNHPTHQGRLDSTEPARPMRSHPLRTNMMNTRTHANRKLVVGDAAGLVSPFTGEGIASAMRSGELAAAQILSSLTVGDFSEKALAGYTKVIRAKYGPDKRVARFLRSILKNPNLLDRAFRHMRAEPDLGYLFGQIFLDERSPRALMNFATVLRLLF